MVSDHTFFGVLVVNGNTTMAALDALNGSTDYDCEILPPAEFRQVMPLNIFDACSNRKPFMVLL